MGKANFSEEFKRDAVAQITERGYPVAEVPGDIEAEIPTLIVMRRLQLMGWVGYQQQHLDFAREIGPGFTVDTCRLANQYLERFE